MLAAPAISGGALHKALAFIAPKMVGGSVFPCRDVAWVFKQQAPGACKGHALLGYLLTALALSCLIAAQRPHWCCA